MSGSARGKRQRAAFAGGLAALTAVAVAGLFAGPAAGGGSNVHLFKSGKLRYAVGKAEQGPAALDLSVNCPAGTRLAGGGGSIPGPPLNRWFSTLAPFDVGDGDGDADNGYRMIGHRGAIAGTSTVRTVAICLKRGQSQLYYRQDDDTLPAGNNVSAANIHSCISGAKLTQEGLFVDGPSAQVEVRGLFADLQGGAIDPSQGEWKVAKDGGAKPYVAHTICLQPEGGSMRYRIEYEQVSAGETATVKVDCPGKSKVIGGGFGDFVQHVSISMPFDDNDEGKVPDDGWKVRMYNEFDNSADEEFAQAFCLK